MSIDVSESNASVITIAQALLLREKDRSRITPAMIGEKVDLAIAVTNVTSFDRDEVVAELIRRFSLWIGQDSLLFNDEGHMHWLIATRKSGWRYWPRYRAWLEKDLSVTAVDALDKSTDRILGLLEDPARDGPWDRRGLVVGHVQSGKTGNYTGLVCKAADAGYKIIIILAGLHNNLRSQTQIRLEEGFLGYKTTATNGGFPAIGVGELDSDVELRPNCATNRSNSGDFNTKVEQHFAVSPEQIPWLFVIKKNKTVLDRLLKWIRNHVADTTESATGRRYVANRPLLVLDDESDHASVDTGEQNFDGDGKPNDDHEPKAINSRIRKLLHSFSRSAYIGYTATPFANIFIHRRNATSEEGSDLFPEAFIINLAGPSNYVGPSRMFGLLSAEGRSRGLPLTRVVSDAFTADGAGGWMPLKHKKEHIPVFNALDTIPTSLYHAIGTFVIACAVRNLRGQQTRHSSMLIHVTRLNLVQNQVHRQVETVVKGMRQRMSFRQDHESLIEDLKNLWESDFIPTSQTVNQGLPVEDAPPPLPSWSAVLETIAEVLDDVEVRKINGTAKDALDYDERREKGLKVIAIGGDKLARGLTLEGLCVSYFLRASKMYDTLMQMGRWFGYRPGYLDLCRLFTTSELIEWFGHIADVSEELREEFDTMEASGATPREYGLRVQSHPVMLVTSPLKMRSARTLRLSFSGESVETVSFVKTPSAIADNLAATDRLLSAIGPPMETDPTRLRGAMKETWTAYLWNDISAELICEFLSSYRTHPSARKVNSKVLTDFVKQMSATGELTSWTVALMGGGRSSAMHTFGNGLVTEMLERAADAEVTDRYSIGRLLSPRDEAIDLDSPAWLAALELARRSWKPDPARKKGNALPDAPNGPAIRKIRGMGAPDVPAARERGVLLLYPLDPNKAGVAGITVPIVGFGISFPASSSGVKVEYEVDHLLWETEYGAAD